MEKKTQKEMFNEIIAMATENDRADIVEFCNGRIAQLEKKTANRKPSKAQTANEEIKASILAVLADAYATDKLMTSTEIATAVGITVNKSTALLTLMSGGTNPKEGVEYTVDRIAEGKKVHFRIKPEYLPSEGEGEDAPVEE